MPDVIIDRNLPVAMRDGVELATDIYRPPGEEPVPTLVHRIPYDKSFAWYTGSLMFNPLTAAERGYAVIVQDTRGRFNSEGEWKPFQHEREDGYDTVEWAATQPWSNGRIGVYGSSYMGATTWQTAVADPPHLEAAVAYLTGGDYHNGWAYSGGAFELGFNVHWGLGLSWNTLERLELPDEERTRIRDDLRAVFQEPETFCAYRPLRELPGISEASPYWHEWMDHPSYDEYWEAVDVTQAAADISVPVLHVTGWFDNFLRGHLDVYKELTEADDSPTQQFLIGPWDHGAYLSSTPAQVGDRRFDADVAGGLGFMRERTLNWFDRWLRSTSTDNDILEPQVRYFDIGRGSWHGSHSWPPEIDERQFYLSSRGTANSRFGDGVLLGEPPEEAPPDSYVYDPDDPVPTCGGRTLMPEIDQGGIQDQSWVEERQDVLVYTSPHLVESISIAGRVMVTLHAVSSAPDTDFTAKLVDVAPDGYCANIADGILRVRYRDGMENPHFLTPGEAIVLDIDLWGIAHTFDAGHCVRLELSSSNFPRYDPNPNVAKPIADVTEDEVQTATQHIYHDVARPSHLRLPIIDQE